MGAPSLHLVLHHAFEADGKQLEAQLGAAILPHSLELVLLHSVEPRPLHSLKPKLLQSLEIMLRNGRPPVALLRTLLPTVPDRLTCQVAV